MLWLWILLAAALLILLLCRTWAGVWASYSREGTLRLDVRIGLFRIRLLPAKQKKEKKARKPKKEKKKKEAPGNAAEKKKLSLSREDVEDALRTLLPALKRTLRRTRQGIRIKPLTLSLELGGKEDPASAAQLCGELQAVLWTGMPALEQLVDIRNPQIHTGVDFEASAPVIQVEAGAAFRIGTLFAMGFGLAVPALKWFLRRRKRRRLSNTEKQSPAEKSAA